MNAFVLIGIAQAIFLAGLLLVKKNRQVFDHILMAWLLINAIQLYFFYINFTHDIPPQSPWLMVGGIWPYFSAPILYFYVVALVRKERFKLIKYLHHFLPFAFFASNFIYYYYTQNPQQIVLVKDGFIQFRGSFPWYIGWYAMIMAFFSFLYPALSLFLLFRHTNRIENEFSFLERINLNWLKYWILLSMFGFWISFGIIHAADFRLVEFIFSFHVVAAALVVHILVIGFYGLRQTTIFTNFSQSTFIGKPETKKYKSSTLKDDDLDGLVQRLDDVMKNQKPFLNNQLTIDDLAEQLQIKKHDLSQVINEVKGQNFYNFVNGHRIEEFKSRVNDTKYNHLSLLGIALDAGFNSKSSFNHIFKKTEGITPSEYKLKKSK